MMSYSNLVFEVGEWQLYELVLLGVGLGILLLSLLIGQSSSIASTLTKLTARRVTSVFGQQSESDHEEIPFSAVNSNFINFISKLCRGFDTFAVPSDRLSSRLANLVEYCRVPSHR